MKKLLIGLLALSSISVFASTDFKCTVSYPNQTPDKRIIHLRASDDGSLCTVSNGACYLDIREVIVDAKTTALLIDGMGVKLLNVPTGFRKLDSFRGLEELFSDEPKDLVLVDGQAGIYKMGCKKI